MTVWMCLFEHVLLTAHFLFLFKSIRYDAIIWKCRSNISTTIKFFFLTNCSFSLTFFEIDNFLTHIRHWPVLTCSIMLECNKHQHHYYPAWLVQSMKFQDKVFTGETTKTPRWFGLVWFGFCSYILFVLSLLLLWKWYKCMHFKIWYFDVLWRVVTWHVWAWLPCSKLFYSGISE